MAPAVTPSRAAPVALDPGDWRRCGGVIAPQRHSVLDPEELTSVICAVLFSVYWACWFVAAAKLETRTGILRARRDLP